MVKTRRTRVASLVAVAALVLFASAACGSSNDNGNDKSSGGSSSGSGSTGKVGVILPDATTSPRWEGNDRPSLTKAFSDAGIKSDIQNAGGDTAKFGTICDSMINEGVKVLMIVNLDSDSGSACLKKATTAGITSIDYDRLTLGGGASYYVSFDNVVVGNLMGQGLEKCLTDEGKTKANIIYINGAETDNNAALFKQGYAEALKPKIDSGDYTLVGDVSGEWKDTVAANAFDGLYTKAHGKIDGIISANDTMAGGIVARLKANGLAGKVPVTGQDATVEGLQNILAGTQCMTIQKSATGQASALADAAIAMVKGDKPNTTGTVHDDTGNRDVPAILLDPVAIDKANVKAVIDSGDMKASDLCTGKFAQLCTDAGIS